MSTFDYAGPAYTYAAINGLDFDAQDNWCEACRAYHVGYGHGQAVPVECGAVGVWSGSSVEDCNRPPHTDPDHRTLTGTMWR